MARVEWRNITYAGLLGASALGLGACSTDIAQSTPKSTEAQTASENQAQDINNTLNKLAPLIIVGIGATIGAIGLVNGSIEQTKTNRNTTKIRTVYEHRNYIKRRPHSKP